MRKSVKNSILNPSAPTPEMAPFPEKTVLVGIDWADKEHAFSALLPDGKHKAGSFKKTKTGIDDWIQEIAKLAIGTNYTSLFRTLQRPAN